MELSNTDRQIIEKLREDARQSHRAVAKGLGVSEETVRRRIHAMVDAEVLHFGIKVSAKQLGYDLSAMLIVKTQPPFETPTLAALDLLHENGIQIDRVDRTLDHRLVLVVSAEDIEAVHALIGALHWMDDVEDVAVDIFHNEGDWHI